MEATAGLALVVARPAVWSALQAQIDVELRKVLVALATAAVAYERGQSHR